MSDTTLLEKVYDPHTVEAEIYQQWEDAEAFASRPTGPRDDNTYCIVIPPPNVTGALHLGHALDSVLQDILIRWYRMRGFNTLWQPGCDHAGIATQAVVERRIRESEGKSRHDLGRDELVRRIWHWKDEYEQRIISQLKLMGCSCDWHRTRFTLDDGLARAVRHMFFRLFKDGLIFRGKRLVNWDTQLQTAVADDEVYHDTVKGYFWHFKYPVIDPKPGEPTHVIIATTRPETMLGDTAVAVNPDPADVLDKTEADLKTVWDRLSSRSGKEKAQIEQRLQQIVERRETHLPRLIKLRDMALDGRMLRLPLVEREIPLIADEWADPTLGSGCVKITPAHDANDYEVGLRNNLPMINVLTPDGKVARIIEPDGSVNPHSSNYQGLKFATQGRDKVVADLEARGLLEKIEDHEVDIGHSDRSKTPIEPYLSDQWFLKTGDVERETERRSDEATKGEDSGIILGDGSRAPGLAEAAMDEVTEGRIKIIPQRYARSYLDWLSEKRDWCISRQLWWGHRISVWVKKVEGYQFDGELQKHSALETQVDKHGQLDIRGVTLPVQERQDGPGTLMMSACVPHDSPEFAVILEQMGFSQDPDVLDTWFSSALWPFSTLGWEDPDPNEKQYLEQYYPTSVLITSRDIITNWVARMVMFAMYAVGKRPFDHVYIHPKILDGRGETMSKSKGNGVDPVDVIHTHGADALRYSLADMTTETQDIRMPTDYLCPHCGHLTDQPRALKVEEQARKSRGEKLDRKLQPADCMRVQCSNKECGKEFATQWAEAALKEELGLARETSEKFEIGRNFCNKLWNAARFAFMNLEGTKCQTLGIESLMPEDRWILAQLSRTIRRAHKCVLAYQYSALVKELREFFWDCLCDWYIELTKPRMNEGGQTAAVAKQVLAVCLDQVLRLFHAIIPFITERLWSQLCKIVPERGLPGLADLEMSDQVITARMPPPEGYPSLDDEHILEVFADLQDVVRGVRDLRARCNVSPKEKVSAIVALPQDHVAGFESQKHIVLRMANVGDLQVSASAKRPKNAGSVRVGQLHVYVLDITEDEAERTRTTEALADLERQITGKQKKLANEKFLANADPEVVEAERERLDKLLAQQASLNEHLAELNE